MFKLSRSPQVVFVFCGQQQRQSTECFCLLALIATGGSEVSFPQFLAAILLPSKLINNKTLPSLSIWPLSPPKLLDVAPYWMVYLEAYSIEITEGN